MQKKYRTKFPVARIKKIMQLDEDVGKVAQATPVLISKALELFMQALIDESVAQTRAAGGKRVHAGHMKQAILTTDQFDFLRETVQDVEDAPVGAAAGRGGGRPRKTAAAAAAAAGEDGSDEAAEEMALAPAPKKRAPRRKKVTDEEAA
ncbi:hypothetical protein GGF31_008518 [Allomyces arbusculus]|nr:hypothetical protein GGF31_008518 [Allomyces arbusculus]